MQFKLEQEQDSMQALERLAMVEYYVSLMKKCNSLQKRKDKANARMTEAVESDKGVYTNAHHKNDMLMRQLSVEINKNKENIKLIDQKYNFNYFEDSLGFYTKYEKVIKEFKGE